MMTRKEMNFQLCLDWPPKSNSEFFTWFNERLENIPVASRQTAIIEIITTETYGCLEPEIIIVWDEVAA